MGNKSDSLVLIRIPFFKSWHVLALKSVTFSVGGIMWNPEAETMERMKTPFWKCLLCSQKSKEKRKTDTAIAKSIYYWINATKTLVHS